MLSAFKSNALDLQEQCFRPSRAMLSTFKSNALEHQEICFSKAKAILIKK